jgi:L,D-transpeptidase catalytic domain
VIRPEQLVQALERIHPRDRELLSLSLRRRVPDEALARLYECESTEVARRRARAIERLADEMELQRGEDLGAVLKALLEPETWSLATVTLGEEFAVEAGGTRLTRVPPPDDAEIKATGPALTPVPVRPEGDRVEEAGEALAGAPAAEAAPAEPTSPPEPAPPAEPAPIAAESAPRAAEPAPRAAEPAPPAAEPARPAQAPHANGGSPPVSPAPPAVAPPVLQAASPVLEMLADRERQVPDPPRRAVPLALVGLSVASLVGAAGVVGATQFGETNRVIQPSGGDSDDNTRHFIPEQGGPLAAPFPTDPRTISCYSTAHVPRSTVLYREPGGRKRITITARTEWGSPRVLGVLEQRGGWLGVQAAELRNGEIAWVRREEARVDCVSWSLHADLSKRTLFVRRDGHTVKKMRVAIGRSQNPTPKGRFTVTDKLRVTDPDSAYGCCVLALSGHQTDLPEYWPGGDRLAVHATSDESTIGKPVSLGCMRTDARRARWLIETVPLGAPMFIRA